MHRDVKPDNVKLSAVAADAFRSPAKWIESPPWDRIAIDGITRFATRPPGTEPAPFRVPAMPAVRFEVTEEEAKALEAFAAKVGFVEDALPTAPDLWVAALDACKAYWGDGDELALLRMAAQGHPNAVALVGRALDAATGCPCGEDEPCPGVETLERGRLREALGALHGAVLRG